MSVHKNLTGADLHEPKGVESASSGMVYVADGSGSGVWTPATSVVTNLSFSTGDIKPTHKASADSGWVLWSNGSIGDGSSSATIRANDDTSALFALYWNGYSNSLCAVSGGRGASAAADFSAHKRLSLPKGPGRAIGIAGGGDLTTRTLGDNVGEETHALITAELASHVHAVYAGVETHTHTVGSGVLGLVSIQNGSGASQGNLLVTSGGVATSLTAAAAVTTLTVRDQAAGAGNANQTATAGSGTAHNNMQPTTFVNMMIKL